MSDLVFTSMRLVYFKAGSKEDLMIVNGYIKKIDSIIIMLAANNVIPPTKQTWWNIDLKF